MRKLIVSTYMTLDGVIENPMWTMPYWSDEIAKFQSEDLFSSDTLLLGRETYQGFAEAWAPRAGMDAFADRINSLPKYVPSTTLPAGPAEWNATILHGDIPGEIARLKQQPGQNILKYGGGMLLDTLIKHHLLDELHLLVYPVAVGTGRRLFPEDGGGTLALAENRTFANGVVALIYQPASTPSGG